VGDENPTVITSPISGVRESPEEDKMRGKELLEFVCSKSDHRTSPVKIEDPMYARRDEEGGEERVSS